jgi:hypothetical protein
MTLFKNVCFQKFEDWLACYEEILAAMAEAY